MKIRTVVTCFLVHGGRIALFRRSDRVRDFRGCWAGVSGSVPEGVGPEAQGLVEIGEETGLVDGLEVLVRGAVQVVESGDTRFHVHPFLVHSRRDRIELDFEHDEYRWCRPAEIPAMDTVPGLAETWALVGGEVLQSEAERSFQTVREDRSQGAMALCREAVRGLTLRALHAELEGSAFDIIEAATEAAALRDGIAAIRAVAARAALRCLAPKGGPASERLLLWRRELAEQRTAAVDRAVQHLADVRILATVSRSGAVEAVARRLPKLEELRVIDSWPLGEGIALAEALAGHVPAVRLYPDAAIHKMLQGADTLLVGADALLPDGSFINKLGTATATACAKQLSVPVRVIAETAKILPRPHWSPERYTWPPAKEGIILLEDLFEPTHGPDLYLTNKTNLTPDRLKKEADRFAVEMKNTGLLDQLF